MQSLESIAAAAIATRILDGTLLMVYSPDHKKTHIPQLNMLNMPVTAECIERAYEAEVAKRKHAAFLTSLILPKIDHRMVIVYGDVFSSSGSNVLELMMHKLIVKRHKRLRVCEAGEHIVIEIYGPVVKQTSPELTMAVVDAYHVQIVGEYHWSQ